ncbi:beta-porphyranase A-like [Haliotis rufescens]|uniref:beta-porphyranase A-like n=1 Tax=Haliotis rufescens TaxID=6454 RepID=UPI00201E9547|nr:beta-porphyranase A-like [Haliotis rufescens]
MNMLLSTVLALCSLSCVLGYTVTIYPEYLVQGGRTNFDPDRWNGKMGLDNPSILPYVKKTGARTGRWLNSDLGYFDKVTEDPKRTGYPNPAFFQDPQFQHNLVEKYLDNLNGYGKHRPIMLELKGYQWPHWMDTSEHKGNFPNNLDAAAETISLFVQAIHNGTNGAVPPYFEPINEPNTLAKLDVNWTTIVNVFELVAKKVKAVHPNVRIGGPAFTAGITTMDKWNFNKWSTITQFMNMSLGLLDFFSFHPFNHFSVQGNRHHFYGPNEARLVGTVDMVETYANMISGKDIPVIFSAHGLSTVTGIDVQKPSTFLDWAYINLHNSNIFTFLELRYVVERAVSFLLGYTDLKGQESINYSILDKHHNERDIALAFHLWENLTSTMKFLRSESQFHQAERQLQSHVLVEPTPKMLTILLHNYDTAQANVTLAFDKGWETLTQGTSTCLYLNNRKATQLDKEVPVHVKGNHVTVPPEATCFLQFPTGYRFTHVPLVYESVHYGDNMLVTIDKKTAHMNIMLDSSDLQHIMVARLRISVSILDHAANCIPASMTINGITLHSYYILHNPSNNDTQRLWATIEYHVPTAILKNVNAVSMTFAQDKGRVAAIALSLRKVQGTSSRMP